MNELFKLIQMILEIILIKVVNLDLTSKKCTIKIKEI